MDTTDPAIALTEALRQLIARQTPSPAPPPPVERLLRATTVATRLGCSKAHVHDLWESGKLPRVMLPSTTTPTERTKRIKESDLDAWIATLGHDSPPGPPGSARAGLVGGRGRGAASHPKSDQCYVNFQRAADHACSLA